MGNTFPLSGEAWTPWKECSVTDERLRFVVRPLDGEATSEVCRALGISRKTGYKIFERYKEHGLEALTDRSRRPVRYANQLPWQIESLIVAAKRDKPHWGARKIRELLVRRLDGDIRVSARSTIHAVRPGQDPGTAAAPGDRHAAVDRRRVKRPLVRRFQGRVQARQWPVLLSADCHRRDRRGIACDHISGTAVLEYGSAEILPPVGAISKHRARLG
jgi:transposase